MKRRPSLPYQYTTSIKPRKNAAEAAATSSNLVGIYCCTYWLSSPQCSVVREGEVSTVCIDKKRPNIRPDIDHMCLFNSCCACLCVDNLNYFVALHFCPETTRRGLMINEARPIFASGRKASLSSYGTVGSLFVRLCGGGYINDCETCICPIPTNPASAQAGEHSLL